MSRIRLGISTCPNDTFAFHALMNRRVDWRGLKFEITLLDVEELNRAFAAGRFDVSKMSFHAALKLADEVVVLPSGSALGFGVGPVLLESPHRREDVVGRVLCPGADTTATLLYRIFHPGEGRIEQVIFSEIMPALASGAADRGVCIHEGRFTYEEHGLRLVEDLGATWEEATQAPLPLGGIVARTALGDATLRTVQDVVRDSLDYAQAHRDETLATMRAHAQEFDDAVLWNHVDLYVNAWTLDLGVEGDRALDVLGRLARDHGAIAASQPTLTVLG